MGTSQSILKNQANTSNALVNVLRPSSENVMLGTENSKRSNNVTFKEPEINNFNNKILIVNQQTTQISTENIQKIGNLFAISSQINRCVD